VAQRALTKALKLRLDHPRPALELSHLSDAPDASGKYLIEAGIHAARRLDVGHVRRHFPRASEFSVTHRGEAMRARATLESRTGRPAVALRSTCVCPWRPRRREVATRAISANSPSCKWHRATMLRRARLSIVQLPSIPTTESFLRNPPR
jgi:hypothetical protein